MTTGTEIVNQFAPTISMDKDAVERARRLMACWNACENIPTESLEANGVASFEDIVGLTKVKDDLALALETLRNIGQYKGEGPMMAPWQDMVRSIGETAREVIAKIEATEPTQSTENPQWTPEEQAKFAAAGLLPLALNKIG